MVVDMYTVILSPPLSAYLKLQHIIITFSVSVEPYPVLNIIKKFVKDIFYSNPLQISAHWACLHPFS